ncbi:MAG: hypothetical protein ACK5NC_11265 [Vibrio sp.]
MNNYQALRQWRETAKAKAITGKTQMGRVILSMVSTGSWYTLREIEKTISQCFEDRDTQAAISARLREVRPSKYGLVKQSKMEMVNRKQVWRYRLVPSDPVRDVASKVVAA